MKTEGRRRFIFLGLCVTWSYHDDGGAAATLRRTTLRPPLPMRGCRKRANPVRRDTFACSRCGDQLAWWRSRLTGHRDLPRNHHWPRRGGLAAVLAVGLAGFSAAESGSAEPAAGVAGAVAAPLPVVPYVSVPLRIRNASSGKCAQASGAGIASNTALDQYDCAAARHHEFWLVPGEGNTYQIRAGHSEGEVDSGNGGGLCVTVQGASTAPGTLLDLYPCAARAANQLWEFRRDGAGRFEIISRSSGLCMDVPGGSSANNVQLQQYACTGVTNEKWNVEPSPLAYWNGIMARHSGKCLDVPDASAAAGTVLQQYTCFTGAANERWSFEPEGFINGTHYFRIRNRKSQLCITIPGGGTAEGLDAVQANCSGIEAQRWAAVTAEGSYARLRNRSSGKCLQVTGGGTGDHVVVEQGTCGSAAHQQWRVGGLVHRQLKVIRAAGATLTDAQIQTMVAEANETYNRFGLWLGFDPATDVVSAESEFDVVTAMALGLVDCASTGPDAVANLVADLYPDRLVVIVNGAGGGACGGPWSRYLRVIDQTICNGTVWDDKIFAHELGHMIGLIHPYPEYKDAAAAAAVPVALRPTAWDEDGLPDTPPIAKWPSLGADRCSDGLSTFIVSLPDGTSFTVDESNIMGPFYTPDQRVTHQQGDAMRATMSIRGFVG